MEDATENTAYNYEHKTEVAATGIAYPEGVPEWFARGVFDEDDNVTSERFWNFVQSDAKRKDAQLASETVIAIPRELTSDQTIAFAKEYAHLLAGDGLFVDWAFHDEGERGTENHNPHLHVMATLRPMVKEGFGAKRIAVTDDDGEVLRSPSGRIRYTEWGGGLEQWKELSLIHI